jgi:hypothetical protein
MSMAEENSNRDPNRKKDRKEYSKKIDVIQPEFIRNEDGRTVCKSHSQIKKIMKLKENDSIFAYETMLTCETCDFYLNNSCFFQKEDVDDLISQVENSDFKCKTCKNQIKELFTVLNTIYYKEQTGNEIPQICMSCSKKFQYNAKYGYKKAEHDFDGIHIDTYRTQERYLEPEFTIDEENRVICLKHSEINKIMAFKQNHENLALETILNCQTCQHYKDDNCYFPKEEIDKIEQDRLSTEIQCKLCGNRIDRQLAIIYSLYYRSKSNVEIPVICCSCFSSLNDNSFFKNSKKRMLFYFTSLAISSYFLISYFLTIIMFSFWGILLFIIPFLFWGYMSMRDIKSIYYLWKGRKYYASTFANNQEDDNKETSSESR